MDQLGGTFSGFILGLHLSLLLFGYFNLGLGGGFLSLWGGVAGAILATRLGDRWDQRGLQSARAAPAVDSASLGRHQHTRQGGIWTCAGWYVAGFLIGAAIDVGNGEPRICMPLAWVGLSA